jgi:hypothetical protein
MKRIFWGLVGLGMGAVLGVGVMRWAQRAADRLAPQSLASELAQTAADWRGRLSAALEQGQAAMAEREAELRAQLAEPGSGAG